MSLPKLASLLNKLFTTGLTVRLGDTLELVLLLDGERVGRALRGVDDLLSKALSNRLDVAESSLTSLVGSSEQKREATVSFNEQRTPVVMSQIAVFTRRRGDTSTA